MNAEDSSIFEFECEWETNPISGIIGGIKINRAFDAMKTGNRQTGVVHECLVPGNRIFDTAKSRPVQHQFSAAGQFFDKFKHESKIY